jgi:hypothetical protein
VVIIRHKFISSRTTACPPVKDGIPLYWDSHHPTATAARQARAFEPLASALQSALP